LIAGVTLVGCGYVGDPRPPSLQIPKPPTAFGARQIGSRILGEFTADAMTTDVAPLKLAGAVVRIGTREIPVEAAPGMAAHFSVDSAEWAGQSVTLAARLRGASGRWSAWSMEIPLHIEPTVAPPRTFTAKLAAKGIELNWDPVSAAAVARRLAGEGAFAGLGEAPAPPWVDESAELGKRYEYQIQAKRGDASSDPGPVTPPLLFEDRFPPAVPTALDAVAGLNSIELSWDLNEEADFAGFLIYRAEAAPGVTPTFTKIAGPIQLPSYSDRTARPSIPYRYAISSMDKAGNESTHSAAVEIVLSPQ